MSWTKGIHILLSALFFLNQSDVIHGSVEEGRDE
jgi:hypothetical protein